MSAPTPYRSTVIALGPDREPTDEVVATAYGTTAAEAEARAARMLEAWQGFSIPGVEDEGEVTTAVVAVHGECTCGRIAPIGLCHFEWDQDDPGEGWLACPKCAWEFCDVNTTGARMDDDQADSRESVGGPAW